MGKSLNKTGTMLAFVLALVVVASPALIPWVVGAALIAGGFTVFFKRS